MSQYSRVSREPCNLYRCFWHLMAVCCRNSTGVAQSLFENKDLTREAHRSLQEAPHCDNAPKFKGTVVLDGCSGKLEMCHRGGRRYGSYSPATPQNEGHGVGHSTAVFSHQKVTLGDRFSCCMC